MLSEGTGRAWSTAAASISPEGSTPRSADGIGSLSSPHPALGPPSDFSERCWSVCSGPRESASQMRALRGTGVGLWPPRGYSIRGLRGHDCGRPGSLIPVPVPPRSPVSGNKATHPRPVVSVRCPLQVRDKGSAGRFTSHGLCCKNQHQILPGLKGFGWIRGVR